MLIERYTVPQLRARIAALEIAADHLDTLQNHDDDDTEQFQSVARRLRQEAIRLRSHHAQHPNKFELKNRDDVIATILDHPLKNHVHKPPEH